MTYAFNCRTRVAESRPEVVRQVFFAFRVRLLRSDDPRFLNALRYVVSSYGVRFSGIGKVCESI
jgi:hypothetical protein